VDEASKADAGDVAGRTEDALLVREGTRSILLLNIPSKSQMALALFIP
jgi:hypothetical protein